MKSQSTTYPRTDWSSEIKTASGDSRAASDTGLGGMERERRDDGQRSASMSGQRDASTSGQQSASTSGQWDASNSGQRAQTARERPTTTARGDWLMTDALSVSDANSGVNSEYDEEERANHPPRVLNGQEMNEIWPNIENHLPNDVIESPTTMEEVYRGSMKALLLRNVGNYVVATFLIGTQTTVSWEGILYDVGNDYLAIYQSGRDQYIVSDLYSLKYVEFYDTRRRALCDELLTEQQPSGNSQRM